MPQTNSSSREERAIGLYGNADLSLRQEGDKRFLVGHAVVYGSWSVDLGGFREKVDRGAFAETIGSGVDIRALVDHDHTKIMGRTTAGTLKLSDGDYGLRTETEIPDTTYGRDLLASVERGDIRGMSFAFRTLEDEWNYDADPFERTLVRAQLIEVTYTSIPAYPSTDLTSRSLVLPDAVREKLQSRGGDARSDDRRRKLEAIERDEKIRAVL